MLEMVYRTARGRVNELAATLSDDQLHLQVPATPRWTVHELLAHLVGCASDAVSGRLDGVTSDQWTARHVRERRRNSVGELMAEWDRIAPAADASLTDDQLYGPNLAIDTVCHEADLHEALGLPRVDREHWQPFLDVTMLYLRQTTAAQHVPASSRMSRDSSGVAAPGNRRRCCGPTAMNCCAPT